MGGMEGHTQYNIRLFFVRYLSVQNVFLKKNTKFGWLFSSFVIAL
jgi:hypothetical protein